MSAALALPVLPNPEDVMVFEGRLTLPDTHSCDTRLGGRCLVCLLQRKSLDGEVVKLYVDVEDID